MTSQEPRLLIVGYTPTYHLGSRFEKAAIAMGIPAKLCDATAAFYNSRLMQRVSRRILGRYPPYLRKFSQRVIEICESFCPTHVLVTGTAPLASFAVQAVQHLGITCVNYLTDDPWNPKHRSRWFFKTLPLYTTIFSTRTANLSDLKQLGCQVSYLPFGYDPAIHYPETPPAAQCDAYICDVMFYGGADEDRVPYIKALIDRKLKVHLYGGYWERYGIPQSFIKGMADSKELRWAVAGAKVNLCLVRRANRDGHVMRTYEVPAMGGCMLTEYTEEHQAILGVEGETTLYFTTVDHMMSRLSDLLADPQKRQQLAMRGYQRIVNGENTYRNRLENIINFPVKGLRQSDDDGGI